MRITPLAAVVVVAAGASTAAAQDHTIDLTTRAVTAGFAGTPVDCPVRAATGRSARLGLDSVTVGRGRGHRYVLRAPGGRGEGLSWIVEVAGAVVVGTAYRTPGGLTDRVFAADATSGRLLWRRADRTEFATDLGRGLIAIGRGASVDVVVPRTGKVLARLPGGPLRAVCRDLAGIDLVKTGGNLSVFDHATGAVRWSAPSSEWSPATVVDGQVVDVWIDRTADTYGIVVRDLATGRELWRRKLGDTGGWYDVVAVRLATGTHRVSVSSVFGVE